MATHRKMVVFPAATKTRTEGRTDFKKIFVLATPPDGSTPPKHRRRAGALTFNNGALHIDPNAGPLLSIRKRLHVNVTGGSELTSESHQRDYSRPAVVPRNPSFLATRRCRSRILTPGLCTGSSVATDSLSLPPTPTIGGLLAPQTTSRVLKSDDFVGIKKLGEGGQGKVFLVQDKVTNRYYALKVIEKDSLHLSSYARIFEEQMIMRAMEGAERCIAIRGSFQDHENFYILTDYFHGRDLRRWNARKARPISVIRRMMSELVLSLEEIHSRRIIHRDIKPDNILADDTGRLYFADFGIARVFGRKPEDKPWESLRTWQYRKSKTLDSSTGPSRPILQDVAHSTCGTPGFMSPEVYDCHYSYQADVWSLGVVFHIMLLDRLPFGLVPGSQRSQEMKDRTQRLPVIIEENEMHPDTEDLLLKMLQKDPSKRITLVQMKSHPFFKLIDWNAVPKGNPDGLSAVRRVRNDLQHQGIPLPFGTAYELGGVPFPWFDYVSPQMQDRVSTEVVFNSLAEPMTNLGPGGVTTEIDPLLSQAPNSTRVTRRVRHWLRRSRVPELKPTTMGDQQAVHSIK